MKDAAFLIVDDSQAVRSLVKTAVYNQFGCRTIFTAGNGEQAKDILLSKKVDIIISDWEMPKMSGQELLVFVRGEEKLSALPFIMMTSRGGRDSVLTAIQSGVSHYIVKPFTTEKLEEAVRRSWTAASKRRESRIAGLPKHVMELHVNGQLLSGKIHNISRSGALLELPFEPSLTLFAPVRLHINMNMDDRHTLKVHNLLGRIIRLEARDSADINNRGCSTAIIFETTLCESDTLQILNKMIDNLAMQGTRQNIGASFPVT